MPPARRVKSDGKHAANEGRWDVCSAGKSEDQVAALLLNPLLAFRVSPAKQFFAPHCARPTLLPLLQLAMRPQDARASTPPSTWTVASQHRLANW